MIRLLLLAVSLASADSTVQPCKYISKVIWPQMLGHAVEVRDWRALDQDIGNIEMCRLEWTPSPDPTWAPTFDDQLAALISLQAAIAAGQTLTADQQALLNKILMGTY